MIRVTLRGLIAHKLRFLLTALAVMLGVAFMAGTLVYSDTLQRGFDDLLADGYAGTDAVIRAPEAFKSDFGDQRDPIDESIALLGAVLGVTVGVLFGWVLVTAMADQGITRVAIPVGTLVIVVGIAWVAGVIASLRPSQRAARLDILRAIASQ